MKALEPFLKEPLVVEYSHLLLDFDHPLTHPDQQPGYYPKMARILCGLAGQQPHSARSLPIESWSTTLRERFKESSHHFDRIMEQAKEVNARWDHLYQGNQTGDAAAQTPAYFKILRKHKAAFHQRLSQACAAHAYAPCTVLFLYEHDCSPYVTARIPERLRASLSRKQVAMLAAFIA